MSALGAQSAPAQEIAFSCALFMCTNDGPVGLDGVAGLFDDERAVAGRRIALPVMLAARLVLTLTPSRRRGGPHSRRRHRA
ncbi:MAG: hypothetical protein ACRDPC_11650 [Solirubrobacteraceae bacterium]